MKYVIYRSPRTALVHPVLLADSTAHSQVLVEDAEVVSAGEFHLSPPAVSGNSVSLSARHGRPIIHHPADLASILMLLAGEDSTFAFIDINRVYGLLPGEEEGDNPFEYVASNSAP